MRPALLLAVALAVPALAACTENAPADEAGNTGDTGTSASARALTVSSSDTDCDLSANEAPAGTLSFDVVNTGGQVTEFYLLGEDGLRIVGEVENIGPQLNRQLVVNAPAGKYVTACKPGMKGNGIRADFTVTEADDQSDEEVQVSADDQELVAQAQQNYAAYVQDQSDQLRREDPAVRRRLQVRRRRPGPRHLRRRARPLGADRDRGGVLRRPRPDDGRPRGRPRAGSGVDRLAPDREGPVAAARRGLHSR